MCVFLFLDFLILFFVVAATLTRIELNRRPNFWQYLYINTAVWYLSGEAEVRQKSDSRFHACVKRSIAS